MWVFSSTGVMCSSGFAVMKFEEARRDETEKHERGLETCGHVT